MERIDQGSAHCCGYVRSSKQQGKGEVAKAALHDRKKSASSSRLGDETSSAALLV